MTQAVTGRRGDPARLIEIHDLEKHHGGSSPLRVRSLQAHAGDRIVLSGLDAAAAEVFVHLVTGAALPDTGDVRIDGRSTRDIPTDTEWLAALDRFGLVSKRAVLFESLPAAASLALPLSLSIEPMPADVRRDVEALADEVAFPLARLDAPASELGPAERLRIHLARAVAHRPAMLLLEHPTEVLASAGESRDFAERVRHLSETRGFGWMALSNDTAFARASRGRRLTLNADGRVAAPARGPWGWLTRS